MFNAKFIACVSGVSSRSGEPWFRLELIADTVSGGSKILQTFCTKSAFDSAKTLQSMADCRCACGVTEKGFLTINAVKAL